MLQVNGSFHPQVHNVFLAMGRSVVDRCITMLPIRHVSESATGLLAIVVPRTQSLQISSRV